MEMVAFMHVIRGGIFEVTNHLLPSTILYLHASIFLPSFLSLTLNPPTRRLEICCIHDILQSKYINLLLISHFDLIFCFVILSYLFTLYYFFLTMIYPLLGLHRPGQDDRKSHFTGFISSIPDFGVAWSRLALWWH